MPLKQRGRNYRPIPEEIRAEVAARSGGICEAKTPACTGIGSVWHHVLPRSAGGAHIVDNGLWVDAACHTYIHAHPQESYEKGWLRRRWSNK